MGTLYIVATPIGNLEDITLRAIRILKEADVVLAEDTRIAAKLLSHFGITGKTVLRYDEHSHDRIVGKILELLELGKSIALTTDAGTPGISDPGARLVRAIAADSPSASIIAIPGPSSLTAALSISGVDGLFTFFGFPPHKKGRAAFFRDIAARDETIVLFESPHRIQKTLEALRDACGADRPMILLRELTKLHEEVIRGTIGEVTEIAHSRTLKGEFVLIIKRELAPRRGKR